MSEWLNGRELDAAVAERVFIPPLKHLDNGDGFCVRCGVEMMEWRLMRFRQQGGDEPQEVPCIPEYSESIESAMEVVAAVIPRLPDNSVIKNLGFAEIRIYRYGNEEWRVTFTKRGGSGSATAKTLAEAIYRAALVALPDPPKETK